MEKGSKWKSTGNLEWGSVRKVSASSPVRGPQQRPLKVIFAQGLT